MSEFAAWPHDPTGIIAEALREYVSDGDGEDERVLAAHNAKVRAEVLREAARVCDPYQLPESLDVAKSSFRRGVFEGWRSAHAVLTQMAEDAEKEVEHG